MLRDRKDAVGDDRFTVAGEHLRPNCDRPGRERGGTQSGRGECRKILAERDVPGVRAIDKEVISLESHERLFASRADAQA